MTTGSGTTIATAPSSAAPSLGETRAPAIGVRVDHARTIATNAKAARVDRSDGDGLANAITCIAVMVACLVAYIWLSHAFMT